MHPPLAASNNYVSHTHMTESTRTKIYQQWQQKKKKLFCIHSRKCSLLISRHNYNSEIYRIAGFFRGRKLSRISRFGGDSQKFSPRKSIFKQLDTALVDVVHWIPVNSRKFSHQKSIFKQFAKVFSRERNPLYGNPVHVNQTVEYVT